MCVAKWIPKYIIIVYHRKTAKQWNNSCNEHKGVKEYFEILIFTSDPLSTSLSPSSSSFLSSPVYPFISPSLSVVFLRPSPSHPSHQCTFSLAVFYSCLLNHPLLHFSFSLLFFVSSIIRSSIFLLSLHSSLSLQTSMIYIFSYPLPPTSPWSRPRYRLQNILILLGLSPFLSRFICLFFSLVLFLVTQLKSSSPWRVLFYFHLSPLTPKCSHRSLKRYSPP